MTEREAERNKVKEHKNNKLQQLRETMDQGTTSPKIQQMKVYLKLVDEKLKVEEIEVTKKNEESWKLLFPVDPYQAGAGTSQNMNVNTKHTLTGRRPLAFRMSFLSTMCIFSVCSTSVLLSLASRRV